MSKYEIIIYWSKDDDAFIAEVLELPGLWPMEKHIKKPSQMLKLYSLG